MDARVGRLLDAERKTYWRHDKDVESHTWASESQLRFDNYGKLEEVRIR
jgi:hypothetical protein